MVRIYFTLEAGVYRVDVDGHANLKNVDGVDVYCAAVTTLTNTLATNAIAMFEAGTLEEEPTIYIGDEGEGRARIALKPTPEYFGNATLIVNAIVTGYKMLSVFHPEAVEFFCDI